MSLKYAVIGTGAIGGYYGGLLARSGKDVHFLLNSDYEYVTTHGLQIDSINGNFSVFPAQAYNNTSKMPPCDVILVCLKTTNNYLLKELLNPILHKDSIVILIQNGLGLEADLLKDIPGLQIAGAMAFICSNKTGPGHITHLDQGALNIGSYSCKNEKTVEFINKDLTEAGINSQIVPLELARWKKLVWNIPYNGMTVALNTTTDILMKNPASRQLIYELMLEVIHAANHLGKDKYTIPESFADVMMQTTDRMTPYSPSMKLDFDYKRPLEIEYIYTRPVKYARDAGYEMHKVSMLEKQLRFIESQY